MTFNPRLRYPYDRLFKRLRIYIAHLATVWDKSAQTEYYCKDDAIHDGLATERATRNPYGSSS